jgi:hypothetical protein
LFADAAAERYRGPNISPTHLRVGLDDAPRMKCVSVPNCHADWRIGIADFDRKLPDWVRFATTTLPANSAGRLREFTDDRPGVGHVAALVHSIAPMQ